MKRQKQDHGHDLLENIVMGQSQSLCIPNLLALELRCCCGAIRVLKTTCDVLYLYSHMTGAGGDGAQQEDARDAGAKAAEMAQQLLEGKLRGFQSETERLVREELAQVLAVVDGAEQTQEEGLVEVGQLREQLHREVGAVRGELYQLGMEVPATQLLRRRRINHFRCEVSPRYPPFLYLGSINVAAEL